MYHLKVDNKYSYNFLNSELQNSNNCDTNEEYAIDAYDDNDGEYSPPKYPSPLCRTLLRVVIKETSCTHLGCVLLVIFFLNLILDSIKNVLEIGF